MLKVNGILTGIVMAVVLTGCEGVFGGIYDEPDNSGEVTVNGTLYVDASDWTQWHYLDLHQLADSVAADSTYNTSLAWRTFDIPTEPLTDPAPGDRNGIYTYWYDVFGAGISVNEFRDFYATAPQPEPESWTLAVHRNNVRTNGCEAAATGLTDIDKVPADSEYLEGLTYRADEWNELDVWVIRERMLSGLIGNQGLEVNPVLSSWLRVDIPPMPPAFTMNPEVFVLRLPDGTHAAIQLQDYVSSEGVKCCLTIKYRYPL